MNGWVPMNKEFVCTSYWNATNSKFHFFINISGSLLYGGQYIQGQHPAIHQVTSKPLDPKTLDDWWVGGNEAK